MVGSFRRLVACETQLGPAHIPTRARPVRWAAPDPQLRALEKFDRQAVSSVTAGRRRHGKPTCRGWGETRALHAIPAAVGPSHHVAPPRSRISFMRVNKWRGRSTAAAGLKIYCGKFVL